MKRFLLAGLAVLGIIAGCATQTTWEDPYYQKATGPQPPSYPGAR